MGGRDLPMVSQATAQAKCASAVTAVAQTEFSGLSALLLECVDVTDPIEVGQQETYIITVTNQGSANDKNIKIVSIQAGGYLAAPALTATQNVLQAHPDVNVIVSSGDQMIAGAARAAKAACKSGIKMYGNGCTFEAKKLILQDVQTGCTVYLPRTEGRIVVAALINAVLGKGKSGLSVNPNTESPIGNLGTKANISKFSPEFHS